MAARRYIRDPAVAIDPVLLAELAADDGDNVLLGTAGADTLEGLGGNDTLQGLGGNDSLDGGTGADVAAYAAGSMADYVFSNPLGGVFSLRDANLANGDAGTDTLRAVETVRFADGDIQVLQSAEHQVATGGRPAITVLEDGSYVIAWTGDDGVGLYTGALAQRYAADGSAIGDAFRLNTTTWLRQSSPDLAALPDGGFVAVWESEQDVSATGIYGQRFDADGAKVGGEFQVNTYTDANQSEASVDVFDGGGFVVVWSSFGQDGDGWGVYGQRFDATGARAGGEFHVSQTTAENQAYAQVTVLAGGGFVVSWVSGNPSAGTSDVYARLYSATGVAQGNEFLLNTWTVSDQGTPAVSALDDGGFVAVWHSQDVDGPDDQDGDGYGVFGQRFDACRGQARRRVPGQHHHRGAAEHSGRDHAGRRRLRGAVEVRLLLQLPDYDDQTDLFGQRFDADGNKLGAEFRVNEYAAFDQQWPDVAACADGGFIVSWENTQDGTVYANRFDADGKPLNELILTGTAGADTLRVGVGTQVLEGRRGRRHLHRRQRARPRGRERRRGQRYRVTPRSR